MKALIISIFICFGLMASTKNYYVNIMMGNAPVIVDTIDYAYSGGTKYYVSPYGNDGNTGTATTGTAINGSNAWQTVAKVSAAFLAGTINPGDSILFKEGADYLGVLKAYKSGTLSLPIVIGSYGKKGGYGNITGLKTLTGWTNAGGGIWNITISEATANLKIVTIDSMLQRMGRYPNYINYANQGWLYYSSLSGSNTLNTALSGTPNWTGANVVYKMYSYVSNNVPITAQSGGTITMGTCYDFYNNPVGLVSGMTNYGYFIQNDLRTLDQFGEWYFNPSTHLFSMYFGSDAPSNHIIKASIQDKVVDFGADAFGESTGLSAYSFITLDNIGIEGANKFGVSSWNGSGIKVKNCKIKHCYDGLVFWYIPNVLADNNTITDCSNVGVFQGASPTGTTNITNNYIHNIGQFEGLAGSGAGVMEGIITGGINVNITNNILDSIGYTAIYFTNSNVKIQYNYVKNYCNYKDDGGGIYTYFDTGLTIYNRVIDHNILVNGIGAKSGRPSDTWDGVHPLYADGESQHLSWTYNTVSGSQGSGFLANTPYGVKFDHNTFYNTVKGMEIARPIQTPAHRYATSDTVTNNIVWPTQINFGFVDLMVKKPTSTLTFAQDIANIGIIDNNKYRGTPTAGPMNVFYADSSGAQNKNYLDVVNGDGNISYANWKSFSGKDANSTIIPDSSSTLYINPSMSSITVSTTSGIKTILPFESYLGSLPSEVRVITGRNYFLRRRHR